MLDSANGVKWEFTLLRVADKNGRFHVFLCIIHRNAAHNI